MTFVFDASASTIDFARFDANAKDNEDASQTNQNNVLSNSWGHQDDGRCSPEGINQSAVFTAEGNSLFSRRRGDNIALAHFNKITVHNIFPGAGENPVGEKIPRPENPVRPKIPLAQKSRGVQKSRSRSDRTAYCTFSADVDDEP
ncbi:unnamed protein product [Notodromas monacha]|uniref:Uncharacterized protein n=1 Tax=Notodromas monacha TaxID=399045 RepID=A0A7R9BW63_9CRUS|nr:unnamed protein product [Notodromas monacha]CAG0922500.1 unnamed protein product [Notodromas monacha]